MHDPSHILETPPIELSDGLTFSTQPVAIVDRTVRELRKRRIPMVRVLWRNNRFEEKSWETEENMQGQYPFLFETPSEF